MKKIQKTDLIRYLEADLVALTEKSDVADAVAAALHENLLKKTRGASGRME